MAYNDPGKRYYPSNGTDGMIFQDRWCERCARDDGESCWGDPRGQTCDILARSYVADDQHVAEWVYGPTGDPTCTAFVAGPAKPTPAERRPYRCAGTMDLFSERPCEKEEA